MMEKMNYKLSKFAKKILLKKDRYAAFNSLVLEPVLLDKNELSHLWNSEIETIDCKDLEKLERIGVLVLNEETDKKAEKLLREGESRSLDESINLLYIIPIASCNLKCQYCFIGKINNEETKKIELSTIDNTIKKFVDHLLKRNQNGNIIFYGGEPILALDIIKYTGNLVKPFSNPKIGLSMVTNGTIINDEIIKLLKDYSISIGVSIDGPQELTDRYRLFKNSDSSVYEIVMRNIKVLRENDINFSLSITLSEDSLEDKNFLEWLKLMNVKNIGFNLMHYTEKTGNWKKYYRNVSKFLFKAYDYLNKDGVVEDRILRKIRSFFKKEFRYSDCGAVGGQQLTIKPDGDVAVCHACWNSSIDVCGNINKNSFEEIIETDIYKKWKNNITINKNKCIKCSAISICGGGCPLHSRSLFNNEFLIDKPFCIHTKYSLKELLRRHFEL
jgi:uncharacterized protein